MAALEYVMPRMINPKTSQFNGASDITGLCVDISDGDYNEIWATSSSVPYNGIVEYTKIK